MTNLEKKAREHRLPMTTTPENLESAFFTDSAVFLTFGNKTLMAGYCGSQKGGGLFMENSEAGIAESLDFWGLGG